MENNPPTNSQNSKNGLETLKRSMSLTALQIPMRSCSTYMRKLAPYLLNQAFSPNIIQDTKNSLDKRLVLLNENVNKELEGLPQDLKSWLTEEKKAGVEVVSHELNIDYKSYSQEQILKEVLPQNMNTNLKIDNIKDLKILHLTPDQVQHKEFIGKIVLEKSPFTKTVLYEKEIKVDEPSYLNSFVLKKFELLAGEAKTEIEINEGPCVFKIDLLKVFYESSFQQERERLLSIKGSNTRICDLFGDLFFSTLLAKTNKSKIVANCNGDDTLFQAFDENIKRNQVEEYLTLSNINLYDFLRQCFEAKLDTRDDNLINHIYIGRFMKDFNFLKTFVGIFRRFQNDFYQKEDNHPSIHFYILVPHKDFTDSMRKILTNKINETLNQGLAHTNLKDLFQNDNFLDIFIVQDEYEPGKRLLQCTIKLTPNLSYCNEVLLDQVLPRPVSHGSNVMIEESKSPEFNNKKDLLSPARQVEDLEKEVENDDENTNSTDGGLRRSGRKKTKTKQYEEYAYLPVKSTRESSK